MTNLWQTMKKPILALAPLADVTDAAFRQVIAKYSKVPGGEPYITWTEFVSADGLHHAREKLLIDLKYTEAERPIIAQLFTSNPEYLKEAATLAQELGFDGVDINMGCPDRSVEKQGSGAALIKNPKLARELIRAAKAGAPNLPVSVKTRIGYNKNELKTWLPELLAENPVAVTLHARTRKDMSKVPANWETIKQAVEIRNECQSQALILGNGDVMNIAEAYQRSKESGADGVMLGRAIFGNPWLFANRIPTTEEKLRVMVEHTKLFEELFSETKSFAVMKKHYKAYCNGFDGAKELRAELMEAQSAQEVANRVEQFLA